MCSADGGLAPSSPTQQGTPLFSGTGGSVYAPGDPLDNGCAPCNRANVVPGVQQEFSYSNVYKGLPVLNAAAFHGPRSLDVGHGAARPRYPQSRGLYNENVSPVKKFAIGRTRQGGIAHVVFQSAEPGSISAARIWGLPIRPLAR